MNIEQITVQPDRLIRLVEVRDRVGLGKTKIYAMIGEGRFPKPYRITPAAVRWSAHDTWIANVAGNSEVQ